MLQRFDDCFAELGGFALLDSARLAQELQGKLEGQDLLSLFLTSDIGGSVLKKGIVIPLLGITPGYYRIVVRDEESPSSLESPRVTSEGWVLSSESGSLCLCGLGDLADWREAGSSRRLVTVPPGMYRVLIQGATLATDESDDEGIYELVLSRVDDLPQFSASTSLSLSLFD